MKKELLVKLDDRAPSVRDNGDHLLSPHRKPHHEVIEEKYHPLKARFSPETTGQFKAFFFGTMVANTPDMNNTMTVSKPQIQ